MNTNGKSATAARERERHTHRQRERERPEGGARLLYSLSLSVLLVERGQLNVALVHDLHTTISTGSAACFARAPSYKLQFGPCYITGGGDATAKFSVVDVPAAFSAAGALMTARPRSSG